LDGNICKIHGNQRLFTSFIDGIDFDDVYIGSYGDSGKKVEICGNKQLTPNTITIGNYVLPTNVEYYRIVGVIVDYRIMMMMFT
jgi:hypothetical protein